jgi:hypothetical protein
MLVIPDETQLKMVHAAKCLNPDCDNPVTVPWKKDCCLVRQADVEPNQTHTTSNGNGIENHNGFEDPDHKDTDDIIHCSECGTKYTEKYVEKFAKTMEFTELHLQNMKQASVACILY